jgi:sigma-E factor negative regulatory protein RseA
MNQEIREQLSALIDGELDRDRTRFLLKRAEHDAELVAVWQRWHFVGEAMRGSALPLRRDFARSIAARLDDEPAVEQVVIEHPRAGFARWGGGFAIAASVALVALLFTRPVDPTIEAGQPAGDQIASQPVGTLAPTALMPAVVAPSPYREQDLRPPYRFAAQTVSAQDSGNGAMPLRFDPNHEAYWLRHTQALNGYGRSDTPGGARPWMAPLRPDAAQDDVRR